MPQVASAVTPLTDTKNVTERDDQQGGEGIIFLEEGCRVRSGERGRGTGYMGGAD